MVYSKNVSMPIFGAVLLAKVNVESLYSLRIYFYCKVTVPQILLRSHSYLLWFQKPYIISETNIDQESIIFWDQLRIFMPLFIPSSVKIDAFYSETFVPFISVFLFWLPNSKMSKI